MRLLAFLFLGTFFVNAQYIEDVRNSFKNARLNEENAIVFNELMQKEVKIDANLKLAYFGASEIMLADYGINIPKKISLFKVGRDHLEDAIKASPNDVEIRLVRLIIQNQIPSFLKYKQNIEEDKKFIIAKYKNVSNSLKAYIDQSARDLKIFTKEELNQSK